MWNRHICIVLLLVGVVVRWWLAADCHSECPARCLWCAARSPGWAAACLCLWNDVLRIFKELSTLLRLTHLKVAQLEKEILKLFRKFRLNSPIRLVHINSWVAIKHTNRNGTPPQETGGWNWRTRGTGTSYLKGLGRIVDFQVQEISAILVVRPWCLVICLAQSYQKYGSDYVSLSFKWIYYLTKKSIPRDTEIRTKRLTTLLNMWTCAVQTYLSKHTVSSIPLCHDHRSLVSWSGDQGVATTHRAQGEVLITITKVHSIRQGYITQNWGERTWRLMCHYGDFTVKKNEIVRPMKHFDHTGPHSNTRLFLGTWCSTCHWRSTVNTCLLAQQGPHGSWTVVSIHEVWACEAIVHAEQHRWPFEKIVA